MHVFDLEVVTGRFSSDEVLVVQELAAEIPVCEVLPKVAVVDADVVVAVVVAIAVH